MSGSKIIFNSKFSHVRKNDGYYVDKTAFLEPLLTEHEEAMLFTRPRRFGKSLTMSMIGDFVDISKDCRKLFEGLEISKNKELCEQWMNKFPVVELSLALCEGENFEDAFNSLRKHVWTTYRKHKYLLDSDKILQADKDFYLAVMAPDADKDIIQNSIDRLVAMVACHHEKEVVFIVDEYDRLIENAAYKSYFEKMKYYLRPMYGSVIKDNDDVKFSLLTGCARISIDSMSSGLNNVESYDVKSSQFSEFIGFTEDEVDNLLYDMGLNDRKSEVKEWYDGYIFGEAQGIYCPWDVLKFVSKCKKSNSFEKPQSYWENTGSLITLKNFLKDVHPEIDDSILMLSNGGYIVNNAVKELNFENLIDSQENIWTLLYHYGYITKANESYLKKHNLSSSDDYDILVVPNKSVRSAIVQEVLFYIKASFTKHRLDHLTKAFVGVKFDEFQKELAKLLLECISDFDYHEYFYHAWLLGLLMACGGTVFSNQQSGLGRPDLIFKFQDTVMIVEVKRESTSSGVALEKVANKALQQILDRKYDVPHEQASRVVCWGMGFKGRECRVVARDSKAGNTGL